MRKYIKIYHTQTHTLSFVLLKNTNTHVINNLEVQDIRRCARFYVNYSSFHETPGSIDSVLDR